MFKSIKRLSLTLLILPIIFFSTVSTLSAEPVRPVINSVIYNAVWGVTSFAGMAEAELTLNLTNTADLLAWQAKYAPSDPYTCGTNWSVVDFEGKFNPVRTNTAPFYGGRRVENLCLQSQDTSSATWHITIGGTKSGTDGFTADGQYDYIVQNIQTKDSRLYAFSFIASVTGGGQSNYWIYSGSSETTNPTETIFTSTPTRYSFLFLGKVGGGTVIFGFQDRNAANWATITITDLQVEDVTGQTNQAPSNHMPTTTAAVTEYYSTENENTVSSNVVTEATGDTIENVMGGAFWPSTKNEVPEDESRDLTHINWIKSNGSITAGNVVLIDGTIVADKNTFTASAANATIIKTAYISASGVHSGGIFVRRKLGSNTIEVTIDGGITWVDVTDEIDSAIGYYLAQTTLPTVTNPQIGIRLTGSGDAVYLDWAQLDDGYARVSSHPIAGGSTLAAQSLIAADATNASKLISDTQGYVIAHAMLMPDDAAFLSAGIVTKGADYLIYTDTAGGLRSYDGTNITLLSNGVSGYSKLASYWGHVINSKQVTGNGTSSLIDDYVGLWDVGAIYISRRATGNEFNGIINQVIFGKGIKTTAAEMELETTPGYYCPVGTVFVRDANGDIITNNGEAVWAPR